MFDIKLSYSRFEFIFHNYDTPGLDTQFRMAKGSSF